MKLILQETVDHLGKLGEVVTVRPGYARNYLVPFGKALPATPAHIEAFENRRAELEAAENTKLAAANKRADALKALTVEIAMNVSEEGKLYGSVTPQEIIAFYADNGHTVQKSEVILEGPIRELGEHPLTIKLHPAVSVATQVVVVAQEKEEG